MYRKEFPLIYELIDLTEDTSMENAYFYNFENSIRCFPEKKEILSNLENEFKTLDTVSWNTLKNNAKSHLIMPDKKWFSWRELIEVFNEAKGYCYLNRIGCSCIKFIPRSKHKGIKTPDLESTLGDIKIICEVKTINPSNEELFIRKFQSVGQITIQLGTGFFTILKSVLDKAKKQLIAYDSNQKNRRIVYIVLYFDDILAEYKEHYYKQIDQYLAINQPAEIEVVFHNQKTAFHMPITMENACVFNE